MTRVFEMLLMTLGGVWQGVRQDFNLLEIALVALGFWMWKRGKLPHWRWPFLAVLPISPKLPQNRPQKPQLKPWLAAIFLAIGAILLRLALLPVLHAPVPVVSDEFSHLLLADTLLDGRVANPTHPFWHHFETLQVIQQPHYGSDYFPGHAAVLAAARAVIGSAWAGVLFEYGLFLLVLYWMLSGWMPARWAVIGVGLAVLRFGIGSYWINAYHGGFLPAVGGALIAGAFPRMLRNKRSTRPLADARVLPSRDREGAVSGVRQNHDRKGVAGPLAEARSSVGIGNTATFTLGALFGLGLTILALTRPFEGALYSLPWIAVLAWKLRWGILKPAIPAVLIAGAAVVALGMYFDRVTGSPFVTAYQVNQRAYGWPMGLAWTAPPKIEFRNIELQRYYDYELGEREKVDGPLDFIEYLMFRIQEYWRFFLGPVLTVPLLMIPAVWKRKRMLIVGLAGAVFAILLEGAASPHYLAPATAVIVAIIVECCRHLTAKQIPIVPLAAMVMTLVLALRIGAQNLGLPYTQALNFQSWCCKVQGNMNKARITRELERVPGRHLVFVKTKTDETNLLQWIYNSADIDGSRIVWARDLGPERDAALAAYFHGRQVWMVDPNPELAALIKYR